MGTMDKARGLVEELVRDERLRRIERRQRIGLSLVAVLVALCALVALDAVLNPHLVEDGRKLKIIDDTGWIPASAKIEWCSGWHHAGPSAFDSDELFVVIPPGVECAYSVPTKKLVWGAT